MLPYSLGLELIITFRSCCALDQGLWWCPVVLVLYKCKNKKKAVLAQRSFSRAHKYRHQLQCLVTHFINCCTGFQSWNTLESCICCILCFEFYLQVWMHFVKGREESRGRQGLLSPSQWGLDIKMSCWSGPSPSQWDLRTGCGHHSEVPTWASCHKLRKIVGEGLGWHITPCAPEEPSTFLSLSSPSCGLQTQHCSFVWATCRGKASVRIFNYVVFSPKPDSWTASRTHCSHVSHQQHDLWWGESKKGWGRLTFPHVAVSNTDQKSIPSPILGGKQKQRASGIKQILPKANKHIIASFPKAIWAFASNGPVRFQQAYWWTRQ